MLDSFDCDSTSWLEHVDLQLQGGILSLSFKIIIQVGILVPLYEQWLLADYIWVGI